MKLTPKQEKFCQCVVSGMSYIDSYLATYDWNGSKNGAYTEAMKLAMREDIQEQIATLQKPIEQAIQRNAVSARQQQIDYILERRRLCEQKDDEQSIIRYNDQLNKLYGLYNDTQQEEKKENNVAQLDTETLKKLSGIA